MKNIKHKFLALVSFVAVIALVSALSFGIATSQKPAPAAADSVTGVVGYTLFAGNGVTQSTAGTAANLRFFGTADCYSTFVSGYTLTADLRGLTMTNKLQHSFDGTGNWVDLYTFPATTVTGTTSFTRSAVLGGFLRITQTLGVLGAPLTSTVNCLMKNLQEGR